MQPQCIFTPQCYPQRPRNEGLAYNYPEETNESFVPFIGADSALKHPFDLVFEFMDYLNLRVSTWKITKRLWYQNS